jgi:hypothetical protein
MNRFVIVDGLPYLLANGKTYSVRWDASGFTVGAEVELASVPNRTFSELSIKAKCAANLDSIGKREPDESNGEDVANLDSMTVAEMKEYAEANDIDLGEAKKKADILAVIKAAMEGETE